MRRAVSGLVCLLGAFASAGCTLYTSCPTATNTTQASGGSGAVDTETPPPKGEWFNATGNLAGMDSECGNLAFVSSDPNQDRLIAGVAMRGLWSSVDGATSWKAIGAEGAAITNRTSAIVYDPETPGRFWESGLYNAGRVYETDDDGDTFTQLGDVSGVDLVSIDFSDPARSVLLAGGHEAAQALYRSGNGGKTWASIGSKLPDGTNCTYPHVIDAETYLVGCGGYGGGVSGIYRSTDSGKTWAMASTLGGTSAPLETADGTLYWVGSDGDLARSVDQGVTWQEASPAGALRSITPLELPDGRIAALTKDYVVASSDYGAHWTRVSAALPYQDSSGLAYSTQLLAFFV
ncbi:MAG: hypothetical protein ABIQ16_03840, partial [Polyangiaceae bacterium]